MERLIHLKEYLLALDVFSADTELDLIERRIGRIATRVYIVLFSVVLILLVLFNAFTSDVISETISNPSLAVFERLQVQYSQTLKCPCGEIAVPYQAFIQVVPLVHPVCSSGFVSDEWLSYVTNTVDRSTIIISPHITQFMSNEGTDFYIASTGQFRALQNLCIRVQQTIESALKTFASMSLVSDTTMSRELIKLRAEEAVFHMTSNAMHGFAQLLDVVSAIIQDNHILTAFQSNYRMHLPLDFNGRVTVEEEFSAMTETHNPPRNDPFASNTLCFCDQSMDCISAMMINDEDLYYYIPDIYFTIPNFYTGCYPVRALLRSSLGCFFDADCFDTVISAYNSYEPLPVSVTILDKSQLINSTNNTLIGTLADRMFVEKWNSTVNYSGYYTTCSPLYCTYTYVNYHSFLQIFSAVLALIGGLAAVLKILVPFVVRLIMKKLLSRGMEPGAVVEEHEPVRKNVVQRFWELICMKIRTLSVYESTGDINDPFDDQNGRLATRVFFILLISILCLLSLILRLSTINQTITFNHPTRSTYEKLLVEQGSTNLNCPCTNIAVSYNQSLELTPGFHPLCTSNFTEGWLSMLNFMSPTEIELGYNIDFKYAFSNRILMIQLLCSLTQNTIINGLLDFYADSFISIQLLPMNLLTSQIQLSKETFLTNLATEFILTIDIMSMVVQNNQLLSADFTNWQLFLHSSQTMKVSIRPLIYNNCSCADHDQSRCLDTTRLITDIYERRAGEFNSIYRNSTIEPVSGILTSCQSVEALKMSNMALFFNQTALDTIINKLNSHTISSGDAVESINALNISELGVNHQMNTTIGDLLTQLFVEEWSLKVFYDHYFDSCAPIFCSYELVQNHNYVYIVTFILALIGGLSTILQFIALAGVKFLRRKHKPPAAIPEPKLTLFMRLKTLICKLDMFSKKNERNIHKQRNGILATRFYLLILIISLLVLGIYNILAARMTSMTVSSPSQAEFESLYNRYPNTLRCPCKNISVPYQIFISLQPQMHHICISSLLNDVIAATDSRLSLAYFYSLDDLCQLANRTLSYSIDQFLLTRYITGQLVSSDRLLSQTKVLIEEFLRKISTNFIQGFDITSSYIHSNKLLSAFMTNYDILVWNITGDLSVVTRPQRYDQGSCDCQVNIACNEESSVVPGFRVGCYIIDALRKSSLRCFYDQLCMIDTFNLTITLPSIDRNSSFATIDELMTEIFVIAWKNIEPNYTEYFSACQPIFCVYSFVERQQLVFVITIIIGIYGGLSKLLQIIIPLSVKLVRKLRLRRRQQQLIHTIT